MDGGKQEEPLTKGLPVAEGASVREVLQPFKVMLAGKLITGSGIGVTVIVCSQVLVFPDWSIAVHLRKIVPVLHILRSLTSI